MNRQKKYLLTLGTFFPLITLASGIGDTLDWMGIHVFVAFTFIAVLIFAKIDWMGKGIMILIFIVAEYLNMKLTVGLPYSDDKLLLSIISVAAPILTTVASYWTLKNRFRRKIN